jgi:Tol biopolymer transport system component
MSDAFFIDRQLGLTELISADADGIPGNQDSWGSALSTDGRFFAFTSAASNLVPGDNNGVSDIFVVDRRENRIERVSVSRDGIEGNLPSDMPSISADGRYVAFRSSASNLVSEDTNGVSDIFVVDRQTGFVERVSVASDGTQGNDDSDWPTLSADGRFVAFTSRANNLVAGDTNFRADVFVFDRQHHTIERVSVNSSGVQGNGDSGAAAISADGRWVAFQSDAANLVPDDTNNGLDVFLFDRQERIQTRVSVAAPGALGAGYGQFPEISADGRWIAFTSISSLVPEDENGVTDVYIFDRFTQTLERVSTAPDGTELDCPCYGPTLSADGRFVAFGSLEGNTYVVDRNEQTIGLVNAPFVPTVVTIDSATVAHNGITGVMYNHTRFKGAVVGHVRTKNSLYVNNRDETGTRSDISWDVKSLGYNLVEQSGFSMGLPSDRVDPFSDKRLGPLQANGGPTWTHALLIGSPAIDAADPTAFPAVDQRGVLRPREGDGLSGSRADIGAFEFWHQSLAGVVYHDVNGNGVRDESEPGLAGWLVYLDLDADDLLGAGEPWSVTRSDDFTTPAIVETGRFSFADVEPGFHRVRIVGEAGWRETPSTLRRYSAKGGSDLYYVPQLTISGDESTLAFLSTGRLTADDTDELVDLYLVDRLTGFTERIGVAGSEYGASTYPALNGDARFVAFSSVASHLVPGDTNDAEDVFLFDRLEVAMERISVAVDGVQGNSDSRVPALSADGRFVAFVSSASNLVPGDFNGSADVFVVDRRDRTIQRVSISGDGLESNADSDWPSISADGRFVAFKSWASNLVPGDTNDAADVFVYDRHTGAIDRVSIASDGTQANGSSGTGQHAISANGRFVVFVSEASNLVVDDNNLQQDVFVFDRQTRLMERVSVAEDGSDANSWSDAATISADGRFVGFTSFASNLVPGDTNAQDIFLFDRQERTMERMNVGSDGAQTSGLVSSPAISATGGILAFMSTAPNLVSDDGDAEMDVFVAPNRKVEGSGTRVIPLLPGRAPAAVDFGIRPDAGEIRGRVFQDIIASGVYEQGEPAVEGVNVYLDLNFNGRWDAGEPRTHSAADGTYSFAQIDSYREYQIGVAVPDGFSLVLPTADENGFWRVFLPAGGTVGERDFGFRKATTGGQFENAAIRGRVFRDGNGNGVFDEHAGEVGLAGATLFLDLNDDGIRQFNEPRTITRHDDPATPGTDESGLYSFPGLGYRTYTVRALSDSHQRQTGPLGNQFTRVTRSLSAPGVAFSNPHDAAIADLTGDGIPDLAVTLFDRSTISILPGDGQGGFLAAIDVPLAPAGIGPTALLSGDFDRNGSIDLAVVNSFSNSVTILLNFTGASFASVQHVTVGMLPRSISSGDFDRDGDLDLVVANEKSRSLTILRNDGSGHFTAATTVPTGGFNPFSVVAAQLTDDNGDLVADEHDFLDLVVANFGQHPTGADLGNVTVLRGNGNGTFAAPQIYTAGFGPAAVAAADLDGDGFADLAVANFLSDTISLLMNRGDGTFPPKAERPPDLSAGKGPADIEAQDMDNDGDIDLVIINRNSKDVSILRNLRNQSGFGFEPGESFGVGDFPTAVQLTVSAGDIDRDGVMDMVVINGSNDSLTVLRNMLIGGAHRVALTGVETVSGLNFAIQPVNFPPTLDPIPSPLVIDEDAPEQIVALSGISAGTDENQALTVSASSDQPGLTGSLTVSYQSPAANGSIRFTPQPDQFGTAIITVTVRDAGLDGQLGTDDDGVFSRSLTVTVRPVNDPPTLAAIPDLTILEDAGEQSVALQGISAGGGTPESDQPLRITVATNAPDLIHSLTADYTLHDPNGAIRFRPAAGRSGTGLITVTIEDGGLDGSLDTGADNGRLSRVFAVTVLPVNDSPTLDPLPDPVSIDEDADEQMVLLSGISDGGDGGQTLVVSAASSHPALIPHPVVSYVSPAATGTLRYRPTPDAFGTALITVTVRDSGGTAHGGVDSISRSFTVHVQPINDPPTIGSIANVTTPEDIPTGWLAVPISDPETAAGLLSLNATSSNTALVTVEGIEFEGSEANRLVRVTPRSNAFGTTTITLTVADPAGLTASTSFVVTVTPVNDLPTISDVSDVTIAEDTSTAPLAFTVGDVETPAGSLIVAASSSHPALIPLTGIAFSGSGANRTVTITPAADRYGTATITLTVTDLDGGTASDHFLVTVLPVNDAPTVSHLADVVTDEDVAPAPIWFTVGDLETPADRLVVTAASSHPALIPASGLVVSGFGAARVLLITPAANQSSLATITVTVRDWGQDEVPDNEDDLTTQAMFTVLVHPVNDPPSISWIGDVTINEGSSTGALSFTVSDVETPAADLIVTASSSDEELIPAAGIVLGGTGSSRTIRVTPLAGRSGAATLTVRVTDAGLDGDPQTQGDNTTVEQTFTVIVNALAARPTLDALAPVLVNQDTGEHRVPLSGITAGGETNVELGVEAITDQPGLIAAMRIEYQSPATTGALFFTPASGASGVTSITVTVRHGGDDGLLATTHDNRAFSQSFTVTVNGRPTEIQLDQLQILEAAPGAIVGYVSVSDPDPGDTHALTVSDDRFLFVGNRLQLKPGEQLDRESAASVSLQIVATDANGLSVQRQFTLEIIDVNEFDPVLDDRILSVPENSLAGTLVGTLSATDGDATHGGLTYRLISSTSPGLFALDSSGRVTVADAAQLDYERVSQVLLFVQVSDNGPGTARNGSGVVMIQISDVNEPPSVALNPVVTALPEDASTTPRIRVADIVVTDDALGTAVLSLSGADAALFEVAGSVLYLKAGTVLDYETKPQLDVTVSVDDPTVGATPDASVSLSIAVLDENEPPSVALNPVVTALPEDASTTPRIRVADIVVTDDALGTAVLSLSGADAALFEIAGSVLYLKAGTALDFETNPQLDVTVSVDDPTVGATPDASALLSIAVTNVAPRVTINQAATQLDPTFELPIHFVAVFSGPVTGFDAGDVLLSGTATGGDVLVTPSGDGRTYHIAVSGLSRYGTVIANIAAGAAFDGAGAGNEASTSVDNVVEYVGARWQNPVNPYDVNGDGSVTAMDVLAISNYINANPDRTLLPSAPETPPPFYDVNGDDYCTAADALALINEINLRAALGEGEAAAGVLPVVARDEADSQRGGLLCPPDASLIFHAGSLGEEARSGIEPSANLSRCDLPASSWAAPDRRFAAAEPGLVPWDDAMFGIGDILDDLVLDLLGAWG